MTMENSEITVTSAKQMKLSDAQFVALLWMVKFGDGKIERRPGGFWTIPSMADKHPWQRSAGYRVPQWHTGTQTVMALERLRLVKMDNPDFSIQTWLAPRIVTDAGRQSLVAAEASGQYVQAQRQWNLADGLKLAKGYRR